MIYLASPYSSKVPAVVEERFLTVEAATAAFMKAGLPMYSPIVHCHNIAQKYNLPTDADFWYTYNVRFMSVARAIWVLKLDGWAESRGVKMEIDYAKIHFKPMLYVEPDQLSHYFPTAEYNHYHD